MTINAVLLAVIIMLGLSLARVHVVLSLLIGALQADSSLVWV